jgi:hypothetical protein
MPPDVMYVVRDRFLSLLSMYAPDLTNLLMPQISVNVEK